MLAMHNLSPQQPMEMAPGELAKQLGIPRQRINSLIKGKRGIIAATVILISKNFKTTPEV